jgi:selenocysteine lyase/cysteine desulfurase
MRLAIAGIEVETVPCNSRGMIDLDGLRKSFKPHTRLVAINHASNVNGALQPVDQIAQLCTEHSVPLLLDGAQTAGIQPILLDDWNIGMFACSGHKALLGPPGTGILYLRPDLDVLPLIEGGTGSRSEDLTQPAYSPDRYESGTPNLPGIAGLEAGVDYVMEVGVHAIREHELKLAAMLEQRLAEMTPVRVFRPDVRGTGTVSFTIDGLNPDDAGVLLDQGFDIAVRTGLHCAPLAHRTIGTYPEGTIRVSPGYSTTADEVEFFLESLRTLLAVRR